MKLLVVISVLLLYAQSSKLPSNFKKCKRGTPNFEKCLLHAGQWGITRLNRPYKHLKMPSLEPFEIHKLIADLDTPLVNISNLMTDCKFYGLTHTKLKKFQFDFDKMSIDLAGIFPKLTSTCDYVISGQITILPIKGEGSGSATFKNFHWTFHLDYNEVKKHGHTYVEPKSSRFDGKPENITFDLKNLLQGDQELTKTTDQMLNDNWRELYDDIKDTYLDNAKSVLLQITKGFFEKISLEEAFD